MQTWSLVIKTFAPALLPQVAYSVADTGAAIFDAIDTDGSGILGRTEINLIFIRYGVYLTDLQLDECFLAISRGDDDIDLEEFEAWLRGPSTLASKLRNELLGSPIKQEELDSHSAKKYATKIALRELTKEMPRDFVFTFYDRNQNAMLSYHEFRTAVRRDARISPLVVTEDQLHNWYIDDLLGHEDSAGDSADISQVLHVRGIGREGWDGNPEHNGKYEREDTLREIFSQYGACLIATVQHRIDAKSGNNTSWAQVTMGDRESAKRATAASPIVLGASTLEITPYNNAAAGQVDIDAFIDWIEEDDCSTNSDLVDDTNEWKILAAREAAREAADEASGGETGLAQREPNDNSLYHEIRNATMHKIVTSKVITTFFGCLIVLNTVILAAGVHAPVIKCVHRCMHSACL
eukprot:SAG11_NODE_541_length_8643_cov_21.904963_4_plen_408_part_00